MANNLVVFCGWGRSSSSYKKLTQTAPKDWRIFFVTHPDEVSEKACILGHSVGGALAIEFTFHYPQRVKKLFLVDSEGIYGQENLLKLIHNFLKTHTVQVKKKMVDNIRLIFRMLKKPKLHYKLANFGHHANLLKESQGIKVPTTIIWGEKDYLTPSWQAEKLHQLIPNSKLVILKDMDHDWILHSPQLFWENISN